jgi:hypothetical protein
MEINLDMARNAKAKGIETLKSGDTNLEYCHLSNVLEFIRNGMWLCCLGLVTPYWLIEIYICINTDYT